MKTRTCLQTSARFAIKTCVYFWAWLLYIFPSSKYHSLDSLHISTLPFSVSFDWCLFEWVTFLFLRRHSFFGVVHEGSSWHDTCPLSMIEIITDHRPHDDVSPWPLIITGQWSQWAWSPHVSAGHQRHWPLWATGEVSNSGPPHYTQTLRSDSQVLWPLSTLTELTAHHKLVPIHQARPRPLQTTGSLHTRRCSNGHKKPARADTGEFVSIIKVEAYVALI